MSTTGIRALDRQINVAMQWVVDADRALGWDDRVKSYRAVAVVLHALRDRLTLQEACDLAAQLPSVLRGVYFEGYQPAIVPLKERHVNGFLAHIRQEFRQLPIVDSEMIARGVFGMLEAHVSTGEIEDVRGMLPKDFQYLWEVPGGARSVRPVPTDGEQPRTNR